MSVREVVGLVVLVLLVLAWYLTYTAARLHRLHTRVEGTYAALDAQLVRRAEAVLEFANAGGLDPAGALILAGAAGESLEAGEADQSVREAVESDLTVALRLVVPDQEWHELRGEGPAGPGAGQGLATAALGRVEDAHQRVTMARRFHNDAVSDVLRLRANPFVRAFHLAGHTDLPVTVEFDDDLVAGR